MRTQDEIERVYYDPADTAAHHYAELPPQASQLRVVQSSYQHSQRNDEEGIDDCRVHDEGDELDGGVKLSLVVGTGSNQYHYGQSYGQSEEEVALESADELERVGRELTDIAGADQIGTTSYPHWYNVRQIVMNSVCTRNPGKAAARAYPWEYPNIS